MKQNNCDKCGAIKSLKYYHSGTVEVASWVNKKCLKCGAVSENNIKNIKSFTERKQRDLDGLSLSIDKKEIDLECIKLINEINSIENLITVSCCCGHNTYKFQISIIFNNEQKTIPNDLEWFVHCKCIYNMLYNKKWDIIINPYNGSGCYCGMVYVLQENSNNKDIGDHFADFLHKMNTIRYIKFEREDISKIYQNGKLIDKLYNSIK